MLARSGNRHTRRLSHVSRVEAGTPTGKGGSAGPGHRLPPAPGPSMPPCLTSSPPRAPRTRRTPPRNSHEHTSEIHSPLPPIAAIVNGSPRLAFSRNRCTRAPVPACWVARASSHLRRAASSGESPAPTRHCGQCRRRFGKRRWSSPCTLAGRDRGLLPAAVMFRLSRRTVPARSSATAKRLRRVQMCFIGRQRRRGGVCRVLVLCAVQCIVRKEQRQDELPVESNSYRQFPGHYHYHSCAQSADRWLGAVDGACRSQFSRKRCALA
jgi:hypothetical protein